MIDNITRDTILDYYANLLIIQYRNKKKARETIKEIVKIATGDFLIYNIYNYFDVDYAVGEQLDFIGKIVGAERNVSGLDMAYKYFNYVNNIENHGFSVFGFLKKYIFKNRLSKQSIYSMKDSDYRTLIKFKIISNNIRAVCENIDDLIFDTFGKDINVRNNKNMSVTYVISNKNAIPVQAGYKLGYFPVPIAVDVNMILNIPNPDLIFGFKRGNVSTNIVGFSRAGSVKKGTWLTAKNILNSI